MIRLYEHILAHDDPLDFISDAMAGRRGAEAMDHLNQLYANISIDFELHPDDDFEAIIDRMLEFMESA